VDINGEAAAARAADLGNRFATPSLGLALDITQPDVVAGGLQAILDQFGRVDILINNAANNPSVEAGGLSGGHWSRLEQFPLDMWNRDLAVGLTGALVCSQVFGSEMARRGKGAILNIASDLGTIAPDQRIYRQPGLPDDEQPVKPVSYSVVKHGLIGLTRYLATYWAEQGIRVNAISPGGVYVDQDAAFTARLTQLIPMGRMANVDEYKASIVFLVSDASSYMTGANLAIDGGRTTW
jgi:NAD(P)-dependent dehydrogenase (short-subunit alcohol dehydrogenase family)